MRLDKFLKVSRLIKRRSVANDICGAAKVFVNDNPAKPAKIVKVGDIISIEYKNTIKKYKVLIVPDNNIKAQDAQSLYMEIE